MCNRCSHADDFAKGALFGAAIGAIVALLTAPASGKETREKIKQSSAKYIEEGKEKAEELKEKAEELKVKAAELKVKAEQFKDEAGDAAIEIKEKIQDKLDDIVEDTNQLIETKFKNKEKKQKFSGIK